MKKILKIAVNKNCKNKENPHKVATGWSNILVDIDWLLKWANRGYGWCATHFKDRYRNSQNAAGSNLVVIDIDGDTTLDHFWSTQTAKDWCIATYTSASHSDQEHRFRALFPLEIDIDTSHKHRAIYWLIVNRLLQELQLTTLIDNCGQKPERLWYGNSKTITNTNYDAMVPSFLITDIEYTEPIDTNISTNCEEIDVRRCKWLLENFLVPSNDGEYESYYVPVMAACAGVGTVLFDSWVHWVLQGHHGQKEDNIRPYKWKGLGKYAGHTKLYSLAKKQNPAWTSKLPADLKFGAVGGAVGYTQLDPPIDTNQFISNSQGNNMDIILEPVPDVTQIKSRGRPKKGNDDAAKERQEDVNKIKSHLTDLRKNKLTNNIEYINEKNQIVILQGDDLKLMTNKLSCENNIFIPEQRMENAIKYIASINKYCPIERYLNYCSKNHKPYSNWDNIGKIFLGNSQKLATLALQRFMIGAVARAYNPGCTMSWIPILVGAQGVGKSMFSRSLVPEDLFAEISTPLDTLIKEQYRLHVAWLLELPEVDNYFKTTNIENFKNIITTRIDETRFPYASLPTKLLRRFVMIGTTNRNQFLVDSSGNRRFVPLEIGKDFEIPWKLLTQERDSLWAAAINAWNDGVTYEYTNAEIVSLSEYIGEFGDPDPWLEKVAAFISTKQEVTTAEILTNALDLDTRNQNRKESRRIAEILGSLKWRRMVTTRKNPITNRPKSVRLWQRPKDDPLPEDHILNDF